MTLFYSSQVHVEMQVSVSDSILFIVTTILIVWQQVGYHASYNDFVSSLLLLIKYSGLWIVIDNTFNVDNSLSTPIGYNNSLLQYR